jgi:hypothetical protein
MQYLNYILGCDPCCKPPRKVQIEDGECYTVIRTNVNGVETFKINLDFECIKAKLEELDND